MLARLDSRASTNSPFLGTGSEKVKGQSDTFLKAGSVFYMCRYGTIDCQLWYYSAGKRDRGKRHPREEGGEAPRLHRTGGEAPCTMKGRKT